MRAYAASVPLVPTSDHNRATSWCWHRWKDLWPGLSPIWLRRTLVAQPLAFFPPTAVNWPSTLFEARYKTVRHKCRFQICTNVHVMYGRARKPTPHTSQNGEWYSPSDIIHSHNAIKKETCLDLSITANWQLLLSPTVLKIRECISVAPKQPLE